MTSLGFGADLAIAARHAGFDPASLFASGEPGLWYDPGDPSGLFQDSAGTMPAAVGDPVGRMLDRSGNGNHALQSNAASRPMLREEGGRLYLEFDGVDDELRAAFVCPQPWERISAVRQLGHASSDRLLGGFGTNSGNLGQGATQGRLWINSGVLFTPEQPLAIGVTGVVSERHAGAASRMAIGDDPPTTANAGTIETDGISIASAGSGVSGRNSMMRFYGAVMIGRELTEVEAGLLRRLLARRSGAVL